MVANLKKTVYLDSTIPSYLFDERESLRYPCEITRKWWREESERYDIFIAPETIEELSRGVYPRQEGVLAFVSSLQTLDSNERIAAIVRDGFSSHLELCPLGKCQ